MSTGVLVFHCYCNLLYYITPYLSIYPIYLFTLSIFLSLSIYAILLSFNAVRYIYDIAVSF